MSKRFIISESERNNIISHYSKKGIILESENQTKTEKINRSISNINTNKDNFSIETITFSFWPEEDFTESGGKLVYNFKPDQKFFNSEQSKRFLKQMGIGGYEDKEVEIENIVIEFDKVDARDTEAKNELIKKFWNYADSNNMKKSPYLNLCYDLISKDCVGIVEFDTDIPAVSSLPGNIRLNVEAEFTSITFKVISDEPVENEVENKNETKDEPKTNVAPDEVEDSGLPEGEFEDEVLSNKTKKPSWIKRLLTREKTELMNNLKSLKDKFIKVDDMYFKISDVKVSSDLQGVLVFSCRQQRINADLVNKPKFKFFGKKDFYFACRGKTDDCIFYDSAQYRYNKKDYIYYGNTIDEINKEENSIDEFTFKNICKFINPK